MTPVNMQSKVDFGDIKMSHIYHVQMQILNY